MPARHVVVDGSNIATEGRSLPSLVQLDEAVREYRREFVEDVITVVVDATFGHRIDPSERPAFDEAVAHNEIVSPPAGAIGRGDAFLLRVAEKVGATVLSNDSFQEFHGEHEWLFNNGRLIGGKPVPGVGWIFTPRTPVRGPKSRDSMREARRTSRAAGRTDEVKKVEKAIAVATEEAVEPDSPKVKRRRRSRSGSAPPAEPVNEPLPFIEFVAAHPLGSLVEGEVESFSSHGAFVIADQVRCYIPLSGMGDPPPRAAKEALKRGETRLFALQALDPPRRGIELALPEFAHISGAPTPETVEEEIKEAASRSRSGRRRGGAAEKADEAARRAGRDDVAVVATEVVVAVRGRAAEPAASAPGPPVAEGAPAATVAEGAEEPAASLPELAGPRKRPARPRAGAPRARPGAAPAPLEPDGGAAAALQAPAPARKRAASRKSTAQPSVDEGDVVTPEPAEVSEAPAPAPAARKRRAAQTSPAAAADTPSPAAGPAAAPRKRRSTKVPVPDSGGLVEDAAVPGAPARKASGKRAASATKAGAVGPAALEAPIPAVKKAASTRKAASPRKAVTKRQTAAPAPAEVQATPEPASTDVGPVRKTTRKRAAAKSP